MSEFSASVEKLQKLDFQKLEIPAYQRPYVWTVKETRQLWEDILSSKEDNKSDYRIGTVILHENGERLDIVDGQQRLTTLSLMLYRLGQNTPLPCSAFLSKKQFLHHDSVQNITENAAEIDQWIEEELIDRKDLLQFILENCSFVVVTVDSISEAFQMFDSQNGRGMPLEAYNLLKAYHMRCLFGTSAQVKIRYDRQWESAARNQQKKDYLRQVINEQLYRTRIWSRNHFAFEFSKKKVGEFKGSTFRNIKYPYQNFVNLEYLIQDEHYIGRYDRDNLRPETQMNQQLVNGAPFFEYVHNYVNMYRLLFENNSQELEFFHDFYHTYCTGMHKKGDQYLLELYKSMVMLVFDKFGLQGLRMYYRLIYAYVFRFRLEKKFVKYDSVSKYPCQVISGIQNAKELMDLNFIKPLALGRIHRQENNNNNAVVENFFKNTYKSVEIL